MVPSIFPWKAGGRAGRTEAGRADWDFWRRARLTAFSVFKSCRSYTISPYIWANNCCNCCTVTGWFPAMVVSYIQSKGGYSSGAEQYTPDISVASFDQISMFRYDTFRSYHTIVSYDRQIRSYNTIETMSTNWVSSLKPSKLHNFLHTCPFSTKIISL